MAKVSDQDRKVFTDVYTLFARFHDAQFNADKFSELADAVYQTAEQNGQSQLAIELTLAIYSYFGKQFKRMEGSSNAQ